MKTLYTTYLYQPILAVLVFIYNSVGFSDLGLSIIILTILVRIILFPIFYKSAKDQTLLQRLQPHIKKIQLDHKDNREVQAKALLSLYKEHKVNPFTGFALLLVQLPIFIVLFQIFTRELGIFDNHTFFGLINLTEPSWILALFAGGVQYYQGKLAGATKKQPDDSQSPISQSFTVYMPAIGAIVTVFILFNLPSALGLYWTVSNLFSLLQQWYINRKLDVSEGGGKVISK